MFRFQHWVLFHWVVTYYYGSFVTWCECVLCLVWNCSKTSYKGQIRFIEHLSGVFWCSTIIYYLASSLPPNLLIKLDNEPQPKLVGFGGGAPRVRNVSGQVRLIKVHYWRSSWPSRFLTQCLMFLGQSKGHRQDDQLIL